jgi:hypothetical protein
LHHVIWQKFTDTSEVFAASIIRVMMGSDEDAASTSEMSVNFHHAAQRNNPEDTQSYTITRCSVSLCYCMYYLIRTSHLHSRPSSTPLKGGINE